MEEEIIHHEMESKRNRHRKKQLYNSICQQIEFYFSDANLSKDRFLSQLINVDPYVDLSVFLKFNKIRRLTTDINVICKALQKSEILELSEDKLKVHRITPIKEKINADECTIYVERLPADSEHDWLKNIFSKFGAVDYVSIPKYKHNKMIKGFAFVEFSTPESAQKTLEYFDSIGCKLPTTMLPEQLVSISTFEKDDIFQKYPPDMNKSDSETTKDLNSDKSKEQDTDSNVEKSTKKDKSSKKRHAPSEEIEENERNKEKKKLKISDKNDVETIFDKDSTQSKNDKKDTDTTDNKNDGQTEDGDKNNEDDKNDAQMEDDEQKSTKKKKNRKKAHKSKALDLQQIGLQVLSKKEWKQLRNKYLNLQKQKMKNLKDQLHRNRFANNFCYGETHFNKKSETNKQQENTEPRFKFTPGSIIQIVLPDVCYDVKKFKSELRNNSGIEYIDIKPNDTTGYIRFTDNVNAKKFSEQPMKFEMSVLEGDEEKEYWDKIMENRENKFKKDAGKKQRGRDKLLRKAEKELGKHIKFDD